MKPTLILAVMLVTLLGLATRVLPIDGTPYAFEELTIGAAATGITDTLCRVGGATGSQTPALIQIKGNGIYYRLDSVAATPDSTHYIGSVGDIIEIAIPSKFRAIRSGGANATAAVTCFSR